jgi:hypothetical protein
MSERLREARYFPQKRALQMLTPKGAADRGATSGPALHRETARSKERHPRGTKNQH